jgi:hypothetical protein
LFPPHGVAAGNLAAAGELVGIDEHQFGAPRRRCRLPQTVVDPPRQLQGAARRLLELEHGARHNGLDLLERHLGLVLARQATAVEGGAARLILVGQADDALAQSAVVPLDSVGVDRAVGPGLIERLLLPRAGAAPTAEPTEPAAELDDDRHLARGVLGHGKVCLDIDLDLWEGAVIDVAHQRPGDSRDPAVLAFVGPGDFPLHLGDVLGDPAVDLALELLDDLRAATGPLIGGHAVVEHSRIGAAME